MSSTTQIMRIQVFINLPVADLPRSLTFFKALGYARGGHLQP